MSIYYDLIVACWLTFILVWAVSALGAKRTLNWGAGWGVRLIVAVFILIGFEVRSPHDFFSPQFTEPAAVEALGVALCMLGVALAIWARVYLGRNWGMPMTLKENPELVTTGPYAYIRNPIYSGMFVALLGAALTLETFWTFGLFIILSGYFIYSSKAEEKIMAREFPDQYPAYKARTKLLIPWVL